LNKWRCNSSYARALKKNGTTTGKKKGRDGTKVSEYLLPNCGTTIIPSWHITRMPHWTSSLNFHLAGKSWRVSTAAQDFDLSQHQAYSKKKLQYFDNDLNEAGKPYGNYVPYVVETSVGLDRLFPYDPQPGLCQRRMAKRGWKHG
jgi:hypothetical protein